MPAGHSLAVPGSLNSGYEKGKIFCTWAQQMLWVSPRIFLNIFGFIYFFLIHINENPQADTVMTIAEFTKYCWNDNSGMCKGNVHCTVFSASNLVLKLCDFYINLGNSFFSTLIYRPLFIGWGCNLPNGLHLVLYFLFIVSSYVIYLQFIRLDGWIVNQYVALLLKWSGCFWGCRVWRTIF